MAEYTTVITKKGMAVLTKIIKGDGQKVLFTKMQVGDSPIEEGDNPIDFISLKRPIKDLDIAKYNIIGDGTTYVGSILTNENLEVGFFIWEYGLFISDPETNEDVLYAYIYTPHADWFPAFGTTLIRNELGVTTAIGRAENVEFIINKSDICPTFQDFDDLKKELENPVVVGENLVTAVKRKLFLKVI